MATRDVFCLNLLCSHLPKQTHIKQAVQLALKQLAQQLIGQQMVLELEFVASNGTRVNWSKWHTMNLYQQIIHLQMNNYNLDLDHSRLSLSLS